MPAKSATTTTTTSLTGDKPLTTSTTTAKPSVPNIQQAVPIFHHQTANSSLSQVLKQFSAVNTSSGSGIVNSTNASTTVLVTGQQASSVGLAKPTVSNQGVNTSAASSSDTTLPSSQSDAKNN